MGDNHARLRQQASVERHCIGDRAITNAALWLETPQWESVFEVPNIGKTFSELVWDAQEAN